MRCPSTSGKASEIHSSPGALERFSKGITTRVCTEEAVCWLMAKPAKIQPTHTTPASKYRGLKVGRLYPFALSPRSNYSPPHPGRRDGKPAAHNPGLRRDNRNSSCIGGYDEKTAISAGSDADRGWHLCGPDRPEQSEFQSRKFPHRYSDQPERAGKHDHSGPGNRNAGNHRSDQHHDHNHPSP